MRENREGEHYMNLSNALYDKLKFLVQVILPGMGALYVGLAEWWGLPNPTAVAGSIALVATFLGLFLGASARKYGGAGDLVVTTDPEDGEVYLSADLNKHPSAFKNKKNVTLNVVQQTAA
jgi:hypothetical protein